MFFTTIIMNLKNLINKFLSLWWLVLITTLLVFFLTYQTFQEDKYLANITLAVQLEKNQSSESENNLSYDQAYVDAADKFGLFLVNNLSTVTSQAQIADSANLKLTSFSDKKAFFDVKEVGLGYVNVSYESLVEDETRNFNNSVIKVLEENIIPSWNSQRITKFRVSGIDNKMIQKSETKIDSGVQYKIFPVLLGLTLGMVLSLIVSLILIKVRQLEIDKN
jgi:hypothetical protein